MKNFKSLPKNIKNKINNIENYKNRGMDFENLIIFTCDYYLKNEKCLINKRPTPIKIVKYDKNKNRISDAFFAEKSTTDFNGVVNGKYVDIEAKETNNKTSLPLSNIRQNQLTHLKNVTRYGGFAGFLVYFKVLNRFFIIEAKTIISYLEKEKRKSIPLFIFEKYGYELKLNSNLILDFLPFIESAIFA